jgi:hypothetical protein
MRFPRAHALPSFSAFALSALFAAALFVPALQASDTKKAAAPAPKAAPKAAAPAAKPGAAAGARTTGATTTSHTTTASATHPTTTTAHTTTTTTTRTTTSTTGARPGAAGAAGHPGAPTAGGAHGGVAGVHSGNLAHAGPTGSRDRVGANGSAVRVRANGRPSDFHDSRRGMDVHHNLAGGRRVDVVHGDAHYHYERGRAGYIGHPYRYGGRDYYRRSYYDHGRAYDRFYNHYAYGGVNLDVYAPARFYGVGFYGWAYNPWVSPVPYAWGFAAAPWFGFYGAYWTPYPVYAGPNLWLTDYLISTTLAAAYEAHQAAAAQAASDAAVAGNAPPAPLTPETKALIANEVKGQIALENAEAQATAQGQQPEAASSSIQRILSDGQPHVFVAGKEVDVIDANGQECAVTDGDVLQLTAAPAAGANTASLTVLSSKGGIECANRASVTVAFEDLQEMQNHMRETLDAGLQELQSKQGKGGLPAAPQSATAPPVASPIAANAPPPDPNGAAELQQQAQDSEKSEQQVLADTATASGPSDVAAASVPPPPSAAPPVTISLGQTPDQVVGLIGQPSRILNLGNKTVYVYKDMKVTFKLGVVTNIE